jgi:hypothetical protein
MEYNNNNYQENNIGEVVEKRPTGLTVLCILTFIGSGVMLFSYFVSYALYNTMPNMILTLAESMGGTVGKIYEDAADIFINTPKSSFLLMTLPSLFSIVGAAIMLNMRKLGFHLYIVGQILIVGFPILLLKSNFSIGDLLFTLLFVALYAIFFKKMN